MASAILLGMLESKTFTVTTQVRMKQKLDKLARDGWRLAGTSDGLRGTIMVTVQREVLASAAVGVAHPTSPTPTAPAPPGCPHTRTTVSVTTRTTCSACRQPVHEHSSAAPTGVDGRSLASLRAWLADQPDDDLLAQYVRDCLTDVT